jgi:hypothetical protein
MLGNLHRKLSGHSCRTKNQDILSCDKLGSLVSATQEDITGFAIPAIVTGSKPSGTGMHIRRAVKARSENVPNGLREMPK